MTIALTLNNETGGRPSAPVYQLDLSIVLDTSYPTGGYTGFSTMVAAAARAATPPLPDTFAAADVYGIKILDCAGYVPAYDKTNDKLKLYWCAGAGAPMTEVTNATNLSAVTLRLVVEHQ